MADSADPDESKSPCCPHCGYDLRRLPGNRCPECGATHKITMADPMPYPRFSQGKLCMMAAGIGLLVQLPCALINLWVMPGLSFGLAVALLFADSIEGWFRRGMLLVFAAGVTGGALDIARIYLVPEPWRANVSVTMGSGVVFGGAGAWLALRILDERYWPALAWSVGVAGVCGFLRSSLAMAYVADTSAELVIILGIALLWTPLAVAPFGVILWKLQEARRQKRLVALIPENEPDQHAAI